jgi:hypothetical protein
MTDRYDALIVVLDQNIREDDAQPTINAISQIKHVLKVSPHVIDGASFIAESRIRRELIEKLFKIIQPEYGK